MKGVRFWGIVAMLIGVVGLVIGIVFIVQSVSVNAQLTEGLAVEKVTLSLPEEGEKRYFEGNVIDTAKEAKVANRLANRIHAGQKLGPEHMLDYMYVVPKRALP